VAPDSALVGIYFQVSFRWAPSFRSAAGEKGHCLRFFAAAARVSRREFEGL
jgi:hypothetical protein